MRKNLPLGNSVIILNQDDPTEILAVRRRDGQRLFCLPGGKQDTGESSARGAQRELLEETGIFIAEAALLPIHSGVCEGEVDYWVTSYLSYISAREVVITGEADLEPQWIAIDDFLSQNAFLSFNKILFEQIDKIYLS